MKKSIIAALALSGIGVLTAGSASAQCVWVSCPNSAPPPAQYQQETYYPQSRETYRQESSSSYDNSYNDGYRDGVRAAKSKAKATSTRRTSSVSSGQGARRSSAVRSHNRATVSRSSVTRSSAVRTSSARSSSVRSNRTHVQYSAPVRRQASVTTSRYSQNYRAPVRQSSRSNYNNYQTTYVQPYRDNAATYNAASYGNSINVASYGGRGESWVTTSRQIVRYSTPHVIVNDGGRSCGWGNQIMANGQMTSSQAYVCHCAQGWLPR